MLQQDFLKGQLLFHKHNQKKHQMNNSQNKTSSKETNSYNEKYYY